MEKLNLLARINKLATLVHSKDVAQTLSTETLTELKATLDEMTEEYIAAYC
ncbi:MAG: hypothetical protein E6713_03620 [Sporomusaceae bacterium]|nr:hypothetical protein [Sporomusaceae bacterium]